MFVPWPKFRREAARVLGIEERDLFPEVTRDV